MDAEHITAHFTWSETTCHDGTLIPETLKPNAVRLAGQLEIIRAAWAELVGEHEAAITPVCWYRSPSHNQALRDAALAAGKTPGTAVMSEHMHGSAIDARPRRMADLPRFRDLISGLLTAETIPLIGGWGWYPGQWVHLDVRRKPASGHVAYWLGSGVASEMA
jgi:hypothetical protein